MKECEAISGSHEKASAEKISAGKIIKMVPKMCILWNQICDKISLSLTVLVLSEFLVTIDKIAFFYKMALVFFKKF